MGKALPSRVLFVQKLQVGQDLGDTFTVVRGYDIRRGLRHQVLQQVLPRQVEHRRGVVRCQSDLVGVDVAKICTVEDASNETWWMHPRAAFRPAPDRPCRIPFRGT